MVHTNSFDRSPSHRSRTPVHRTASSPKAVDMNFSFSGGSSPQGLASPRDSHPALGIQQRRSTARSSFGGSPSGQSVPPVPSSFNAFMMPASRPEVRLLQPCLPQQQGLPASIHHGSIADTETPARFGVSLSSGAQFLLNGCKPIVFNVASVVGGGAQGERIILDESVLALVDPVQSDRIGNYELLIFTAAEGLAESADNPSVQISITPWSRVTSHAPGVVDIAAHGVKKGPHSYTFQFHAPADAESFVRDFEVRCRVMKLSLRTARQKPHGWAPVVCLWQSLKRVLCWVIVIGLVAFAADAYLLSVINPGQEPMEIMADAWADTHSMAAYLGNKAVESGTHAGAVTCRSFAALCSQTPAVPLADLEKCLSNPASDIKLECIEKLTNVLQSGPKVVPVHRAGSDIASDILSFDL